ncbi:MAG: hypothetical protein M1830_000405 [Pleopsidium flavum]|nr:MAG: hypothetical protein M1830_000405 [Pleopsidium flavum]
MKHLVAAVVRQIKASVKALPKSNDPDGLVLATENLRLISISGTVKRDVEPGFGLSWSDKWMIIRAGKSKADDERANVGNIVRSDVDSTSAAKEADNIQAVNCDVDSTSAKKCKVEKSDRRELDRKNKV